MSYQNQRIGMMDEGYFVPRGQILTWINDLLQLNITKIEQLGSGAVYCQILDVIHPGKISMNKVNWKAKNDYEFINNFKLLQTAFDKIGIKRHLEVEKLAKAKYQDNLEFIQWFKRYFDLNCGDRGNSYDAVEKRGAGGAAIDFGFAEKVVIPKTYNAGGVMTPKNDPPPKRRQTATVIKESPKHKDLTSKGGIISPGKDGIKQPMAMKQPMTKEVPKVKRESKPIEQYKMEESESTVFSRSKEQFDELQRQLDLFKKTAANYGIKLTMISEIMRSQEECEMKVSMVQQVLNERDPQDEESL